MYGLLGLTGRLEAAHDAEPARHEVHLTLELGQLREAAD